MLSLGIASVMNTHYCFSFDTVYYTDFCMNDFISLLIKAPLIYTYESVPKYGSDIISMLRM